MNMRVLVFCLIFASGPLFARAQLTSLLPMDTAAGKEVERLLDQERDMVFSNTTLEEVVATFQVHGISIYVDWRSMDVVGVGPLTRFNLSQRSISPRDALTLLLREQELAWSLQNGRVIITTRDQEERALLTKMYDVRHLVEVQRDAQWSVGPAGQYIQTPIYYYDFDPLIDLIVATVAPDSWDEVGGPASIVGYPTRRMRVIVISQTYSAHKEVEQLIGQLTRLGGAHPLPEIPARAYTGASAATSVTGPTAPRATGIRSSRLRSTGD